MARTINGTNGVTFNDGTSMATGQQACKAWVNFNGTGTVAIRASYNMSSIMDNGTGDYIVNFTTAMPDANYCAKGSSNNSSGSTSGSAARSLAAIVYSTGSVRVINQIGSGVTADQDYCNVAVFR